MALKRESGSLVAVIVVILFIALMAALGIIFYQNFITRPQQNNAKQDTPESKSSRQQKTARIAFNNTIYAIDYPDSGWTLDTKAQNSGSYASLTTSDNKVQVHLEIAPTQANDICSPADGLLVSDYKVSPGPVVTRLTDKPLYLVEALTDAKGGGYQYVIGLIPDGGETHASVGVSHCEVVSVGMASRPIVGDTGLAQPGILASIIFPELPRGTQKAAADMQTIKDLMNTEDYKTAVKILESARKE